MGSQVDALQLEDYNVPLEYSNLNEKMSKFTYNSWCPNCEKESCLEPCKKKTKEMKSYFEDEEYENMEYEIKDKWHETKTFEPQVHYDCCNRIRSNLCELPTSYIRNTTNQTSRMSECDKDYVECLENKVKSYRKMIQYAEYTENNSVYKTNNEKCKKKPSSDDRLQKNRENLEGIESHFNQVVRYDFKKNATGNPINEKDKYSYETDYSTPSDNLLFHLHGCSSMTTLNYETETYFDKNHDKIDDFSKLFSEEMNGLKEKLKELRNNAYKNNTSAEMVAKSLQAKDEEGEKKHKSVKSKNSPRLSRRNRSKILRIRNRGRILVPIKIRRSRNVTPKTLVENENTESDYSDSDESIKITEEEIQISEIQSEDNTTKDELQGSGDASSWPIRESLFPNMPPYISFNSYNAEEMFKIPLGRRLFKWKLSTITPIIVRKVVSNSGFVMVRKSNQWLGTWGKHIKSPMFKTLKESQKLNHFPGTFQLGRKDRLWRNFQRMISNFGYKEFGFLPHTFILPHEMKLLKYNWENKNGGRDWWIIKPPASARGVGIRVINKWAQIPKKQSLVIQKYISNPYLINGSKFDLRLYVLVTSFHPLRIYLYTEGLVRFASVKYSHNAKDIKEKYMHLTNYSINKLSSNYTVNEDAEVAQGHKWTITKLLEYLAKNGVDVQSLWKNLEVLVIKTMIACEPPITELCNENLTTRYNCYELFGIDVLLDTKLKPWLLEVNISPSLHSSSPLDEYVKGPLVQSLFNMAQFHFPIKLETSTIPNLTCHDPKLYSMHLTQKELNKHEKFENFFQREDYLEKILEQLTGDDVRHLTQAEDEFRVRDKFKRIFPTASTYKFLEFMEARYYNRLFDAWETKYGNQREEGIKILQTLCNENVHSKGASLPKLQKNGQIMNHHGMKTAASTKEKMVKKELSENVTTENKK